MARRKPNVPSLDNRIRRLNTARSRRDPWLKHWRDAYRYTMPQRDILMRVADGQSRGQDNYDSTAAMATIAFANRIQTGLFPQGRDWVKLIPGPAVPEDSKDTAMKALEAASTAFHAAMHASNFQTCVNESLLDCSVSEAALLMQEGTKERPFRFVSVPGPTIMIERDEWGGTGGVFREFKMRPELINKIPQWREAVLPKEWQDMIKSGSAEEVRLIDYCYRNEERTGWIYVLFSDAPQVDLLPEPQVYRGNGPWVVFGWMRVSGEDYSRGPTMALMPDIKMLDAAAEMMIKNASIQVAGVWTGVDDGVFNPHSAAIVPGEVIPVARNSGSAVGASLERLEVNGSFDLSQLLIEERRMGIKRGLLDKSLPPELGPVRSATEIIERLRELELDITGPFARLTTELVEPIVVRGLQILNRLGIIEYPTVIDGTTVSLQIVSPLAQEQNMADVQSIVMGLQVVSMSIGVEAMMLGAKIEDIPAYIFRKLGWPEELIRDKADRELIQMMVTNMLQGLMAQGQQQGQPPAGAAMMSATGPLPMGAAPTA